MTVRLLAVKVDRAEKRPTLEIPPPAPRLKVIEPLPPPLPLPPIAWLWWNVLLVRVATAPNTLASPTPRASPPPPWPLAPPGALGPPRARLQAKVHPLTTSAARTPFVMPPPDAASTR